MGIRNYKKNFSAQGTIEYLVIIAVVIVLSLVVVGLVLNQVDDSQRVSVSGNKLGLTSQSIGIVESLIDPVDGNFVVRLLNNSGDVITVSNVSVGDSNVDFSEDLAQSGSKFFRVDTSVVCEEGKVVSQDVVVTYVTREGLSKTERYPAKVMFDCTPYVIEQANLANQCPSCGDSCSGGSQSLSNSSVSVAAGCYQASDLTVVDSDLDADNIVSGVNIFGIVGAAGTGGTLIWSDIQIGPMDWYTAHNICAGLNTVNWNQEGYEGWRVPTVVELSAAGYEAYLWSSTTDPTNTGNAYILLYSSIASLDKGTSSTESYNNVRCVRSGS